MSDMLNIIGVIPARAVAEKLDILVKKFVQM